MLRANSSRRVCVFLKPVLCLVLTSFGFCCTPQLLSQLLPGSSFPGDPGAVPTVIAGRVVNAVGGAALPRVLVELNGRATLTDPEGRFRFEQPGQPASALRLRKPGFSAAPEQAEGGGSGALVYGAADSLTLTLWPEALLVGAVTASDGEPLPRITVLARRSIFDEQGHHFQVAGQSQTDSHGQFRIPVPAGDYILETQFAPRAFEREEAVLPYVSPQDSASNPAAVLHVASGDEKRVELRPLVSRTHVVTIPLEEGADGQPLRITARSNSGAVFSAGGLRSQEPGAVRLELPPGTYSLDATHFSRDGMQFAEMNVTVPDHDVTVSPFHLASLPNIPIDIVADTTNAATEVIGGGSRLGGTTPNVSQFNLVLDPLDPDPTSPLQFGIRPTQQRDTGVSFAAPPGTYRLSAGLASGWYIRSAASRGTDLTREALVVSPGSSPSPITLVVSNQTGSLQGSVTLSGVPAACWIYLVASSPTLPGVIIRRSEATGAFRITDLPPGSYRAVAFPYHHSVNLSDPAVLERFQEHVAAVTVTSGSSANIDLDAVPTEALAR